ncbi:MAG: lamin tail domain-containing protein, partial [Polyangiaceae bacterium]
VWDDRALIPPPATPLWWVYAGLARVVASEPDQPLLLDGLVPATAWTVALTVVDREGGEHHTSTSLTTAPPMAHVIINEVLANPVGEEPQQEWVELYNDGLAPAHLLGWQLEDVGGEASLPDVTLPPGAFALVVNESFDPESEWDPMPPPNVPLLRVAELGNNGLANGGEPMRLRNAMGVIVSRFPDEPKPKPGQSVARIHPKALDGVEGTFVRADPPTPGAPFVPISSR